MTYVIHIVKKNSTKLFADDTPLFISVHYIEQILSLPMSLLNNKAQNISKFINYNRRRVLE